MSPQRAEGSDVTESSSSAPGSVSEGLVFEGLTQADTIQISWPSTGLFVSTDTQMLLVRIFRVNPSPTVIQSDLFVGLNVEVSAY